MSIKVTVPNNSGDYLIFGSANTPNAAQIGGYDDGSSNGHLELYTSTGGTATVKARLDSAGNLGLGVTPSAWNSLYKAIQVGTYGAVDSNSTSHYMDVAENCYYNGNWIYLASNPATLFRQAAGVYQWYTAPSGTAGNPITFTQAMTLDASGNLGLGTTTPTNSTNFSTLSLNGTTGGQLVFQTGGTYKHSIYSSSTDLNLLNSVAGNMTFATNNTERMRIDSSGNLLVGTTATGGRQMIAFDNAGQSGTRYIHNNTTYNGEVLVFLKADNTTKMGRVYCDGSTTVYTTTSDYRLKENVTPMTGALAKVAQLNPVTYTWKETNKEGEGFLAHELQQVFPNAVLGTKDAVNEDGSIDAQTVDVSVLVATLTAALQELNAKVTALEAQLGAK